MIPKQEIMALAAELQLQAHVVEKDYALGWFLAGISAHPVIGPRWVFKGGTCLKKCYFETYRFSEDLDFTLQDGNHLDVDFLAGVFEEVGEWVYDACGLQLPPEARKFEVFTNPRGTSSAQGRVGYRGQPEQTEEEDGQNQKADAEYVIRRGFIEADLIEAIVVLPGKLFYGNNVPGCLLLLNKAKPEARKGKILMIWASRHFQKGNPQNLLRPSDLMRVLVPWQAFGDLAAARQLVPVHEAQLIREVEQDRDSRLADIEDAYGPVLEPLARLKAELATLEALDLKVQAVRDAITPEHPYFHPLAPLKAEVDRIEAEIAAAGRGDKGALKAALLTPKAKFDVARKQLVDAIKAREKQVARAVKELQKLQEERDAREQEIKLAAEREINHLHEAAADMLRIAGSPDEARRFFTVVGTDEIAENEYNLNLPRYVDTFEPEKVLPLRDAAKQLKTATEAAEATQLALRELLASIGGGA